MRNTCLTIMLALFTVLQVSAQAPQKFQYQAIARDASGTVLPNQALGVEITILQGSPAGTPVMVETHSVTTSNFGLYTLQVGAGIPVSGSIAAIDWSSGPYYIAVAIDDDGGTAYEPSGATQLLSVPYALYAETANVPGVPGPTGPQGPAGADGADGATGPQGDPASDDQMFSVSATGDTLYISGGNYVIIPGISTANDHCTNGVKDADETGVDCGGADCAPCGDCDTDINFNEALTYGSVTDIDGNTYRTITIGTQEWMAENLRTTRYQNGDDIPNRNDTDFWVGAWSHYENAAGNECPYGKLYNWYAVAAARNVCPEGWHVPTDAEWTVLTNYLGGEDVAGGKMKSTGNIDAGTGLWFLVNVATNSSGYSGLPGGHRSTEIYPVYASFEELGEFGWWWSATGVDANYAWARGLRHSNAAVYRITDLKVYSKSVRCVRD